MEENQVSAVQRDEPQVDNPTKALVERWCKRIRESKEYFREDYHRMREDMQFARAGANKDWIAADGFVVPIINRHINQAVANLYAKKPTVTAKRRKKLLTQVWDGSPATLEAATERIAQGVATPQDTALVQEVLAAKRYTDQIDRFGETLEVLYDYFAKEQQPTQKSQMKSLVRRIKTCGVGYVEVCFQREYYKNPDETAKLEDHTRRLEELQRRAQDFADEEVQDEDPEIAELQSLIADLQNSLEQGKTLLREGPVDQYPRSTEVIVDKKCKRLRGFLGAGWVAREYHMTPEEVQQKWGVDVGSDYDPYRKASQTEESDHFRVESDLPSGVQEEDERRGLVCVWRVQNKDLGQVFVVADGYKDFLEAPRAPDYEIEGFWTVFALTFNESESEELFPLSDVHMLKHTQREYNRSREYRRLHREANKPKYFTQKGRLEDKDREKLENHQAHAVIELKAMTADMPIDRLIQAFQPVGMDPALYETNSEIEDVLRTVGSQEANLGGVGGETATETSIAESARMTSVASNVDELDDFLSDVARAKGKLMLMEMSVKMVREIAGPGALWPEVDREAVAKELTLEIKAGSSGRPNKAAELANLERALPYLLQIPGVNPNALARRYADLLELDIDDLIIQGLPSITALNALYGRVAPSTGDAQTDPNQQGEEGGQNAPNPQMNEPGAQPAMPGGQEMVSGQVVN